MSRRRTFGAPAFAIAVAAVVLGACAQPPGIEGARCPCPSGFFCDLEAKICVAGTAPTPVPPMQNLPPPGPPLPMCAQIGSTPARPLSAVEYRFSIADLLGVELAAGELPAPIQGDSGFSNSAERTGTTELLRKLATTVIARVQSEGRLPALVSCDRAQRGDETCGAQFVDQFGQRAYRRPLLDVERAALLASFAAGKQMGFEAGIVKVMAEVLAADQFLVRREVGSPRRPALGRVALTGYELAARMSYLLWASTPDDALLAAAGEGRLDTAAGIRAEAERMLADGKSARGYLQFFREWMDFDSVMGAGGAVAAFTPELQAASLASAEQLVAEVVHRDDGTLATWLTWPTVFATRSMAQFYGLALPSGSSPDWVTPLGDQKRFGLLTAPAWLVDGAGDDEVNPIKRGVWIRGRLMCRELPPPPSDIPPMPEPVPTKTKRERYEQHRANPVCALCHAGIDPLGFALENYDGVGRWRVTDGLFDIEPAGEVPGMKFTGLEDLAQQLSTSPEVRACAVQQWFRYGFGRRLVGEDQCALESLGKAFAEGGYRTRALLLALVASETFTTLPAAAP